MFLINDIIYKTIHEAMFTDNNSAFEILNAKNFESLSEPRAKPRFGSWLQIVADIERFMVEKKEYNDIQLNYIVNVINRNLGTCKDKYNAKYLLENSARKSNPDMIISMFDLCNMPPIKNISVVKGDTYNWTVVTEHEEPKREGVDDIEMHYSTKSKNCYYEFEINIYKCEKCYIVEFHNYQGNSAAFWDLFYETKKDIEDMRIIERLPYLKLMTSSLKSNDREKTMFATHIDRYVFNECICKELCTFLS
jgi:hypothetical protein